MPVRDLHERPFDDSTIAKLGIFEDYAQAWLPTFIMANSPEIGVFDFFAGTGYDKNGIAGSPIRILRKVKEQIGNIFQKKTRITLFLNEYDSEKLGLLKLACSEFLDKHPEVKHAIQIEYFNEDFGLLFPKLILKIRRIPSLIYLDQNGIKFLNEKYLLELEKTKQTDFLYFVSASFFLRFGNQREFRAHFNIDMDVAKNDPYRFIHRNVLETARRMLSTNTPLKLYPFSIKKGSNIHGIIFGATHPLAVEKYLQIAWKTNPTNGEANFDIDDDRKKVQLDLFSGKQLTKIEAFQGKVKDLVLSAHFTNNFDLYEFALCEGHLGRHAADCVKTLKKQGLIEYIGPSPCITYEMVYKERKMVEFKLKRS